MFDPPSIVVKTCRRKSAFTPCGAKHRIAIPKNLMIAEILNRDFVLQQMADVRERLSSHAGSAEDREVVAELTAAEERERKQSSGQVFPLPAGRRRGTPPVPLDDFSFLSRDPIVSIFQSALDAYFDVHSDRVIQAPPADDHRRGPGDEIMVTDRTLGLPPPQRIPTGRRSSTDSRSRTSNGSDRRLLRACACFAKGTNSLVHRAAPPRLAIECDLCSLVIGPPEYPVRARWRS